MTFEDRALVERDDARGHGAAPSVGVAPPCAIAPDNRHFIDIYQTHDTPPATRLVGEMLVVVGTGFGLATKVSGWTARSAAGPPLPSSLAQVAPCAAACSEVVWYGLMWSSTRPG